MEQQQKAQGALLEMQLDAARQGGGLVLLKAKKPVERSNKKRWFCEVRVVL